VSSEARLLELRDITVEFRIGARGGRRSRVIRPCDDVSLDVRPGETVGLVGESGAGKSTLGRVAVMLQRPGSGEVRYQGRDLSRLPRTELRRARASMQMIFQDPRSSLNPRWRAGRSILRPLEIHGLGAWADREEALAELLAGVGLDPGMASRYPHELSGGQAQRVCIARAFALRPGLVVADEALSALDVTTQASIIELMMGLQERHGTAFLFISHDLRAVRRLSARVAVMNQGRLVECRPTAELFDDPREQYTRKLLTDVVHARESTQPTPGNGV
jgi:peptide/nickel transport system ATP-binding protein